MSEKILFKNGRGEELTGKLFRGGILDKSVVLFSHQKGSDSEFGMFNDIAQNLSNNNIPYFKFDYSGHGQSQGDQLDFDIEKGIGDMDNAIKFLQSKGFAKVLVVGHGDGALVGLKSAIKNPVISAICLISPGDKNINLHELLLELKGLEKFVLIIHGSNDKVHLPDFSANLDMNLMNSDLLLMEGADAEFSHPRDFQKVVSYTLDFVFKNK